MAHLATGGSVTPVDRTHPHRRFRWARWRIAGTERWTEREPVEVIATAIGDHPGLGRCVHQVLAVVGCEDRLVFPAPDVELGPYIDPPAEAVPAEAEVD
jgi:hypothetical protein